MNPITPNTRVRILARCSHHGQQAVIAAVVPDQAHPYRIDTLAPWPLYFGADEIAAVVE